MKESLTRIFVLGAFVMLTPIKARIEMNLFFNRFDSTSHIHQHTPACYYEEMFSAEETTDLCGQGTWKSMLKVFHHGLQRD